MWRANSLEKIPDSWKDWGQEEKKATEDEMVGWHHQLNGRKFAQTPRDSGWQGSLVSRGVPKSWIWLNKWTTTFYCNIKYVLNFLVMSTLCGPMNCSPAGSSVQGISQSKARLLEWVPISSSRDLPKPGIKPDPPALSSEFLTTEPPGKPDICNLIHCGIIYYCFFLVVTMECC